MYALMPFAGLLTAYVAVLGRPDAQRFAVGFLLAVAGVLLFATHFRRYRLQNPQPRRGRRPEAPSEAVGRSEAVAESEAAARVS